MPPNRRRARHDGMFHEATAKAKSEAGACAGDDLPPQNRCRQVVRFLFATHAKATAGFTYELECIIVFRVDLHVLLFPSGRPGGCQVPLRRSTALPSAGALPFAGPRSDGPRHRAGHGAAPSIRPRRPQSANLQLAPLKGSLVPLGAVSILRQNFLQLFVGRRGREFIVMERAYIANVIPAMLPC